MSKFGLDISVTPESIIELQDCVILLKWRTGMALDESEIEDLQQIINNFSHSNQLLIKMPWGSE